MRKKILRRVLAVAAALGMAFSLAACGGKGDEQGGQNRERPEWVYVPEYIELDGEGSYWSMRQEGDYLYYEGGSFNEETGEYTHCLNKYSLLDGSVEATPLPPDANLNSFAVTEDGSIYAVNSEWLENETTGEYDRKYVLVKYDAAGNEAFRSDFTETAERENVNYIHSMVVDGQGRVYLFDDSNGLLFDAEGGYAGIVNVTDGMGSWINTAGTDKEGKVYTCGYAQGGRVLKEIDFDKRAVANTYENFPNSNGDGLTAGIEKDFLVYDGASVYEYDKATQSAERLFDWLDSDINGDYVRTMGVTTDGRILAVINDWSVNEYSIALLTKTPGSEVAEKEIILVGTLSASSELRAAAVRFNKASGKYRISIREYIDNNAEWTSTTWSDAQTRMNNDITSGNCPDIIDIGDVDAEQLASKGVFEDLTSFLENSRVLKKQDFVENVLEGYTYDGLLVGIPKTFTVETIAGGSADVGSQMGWTLEDIVAYADAHPDANLFDYAAKSRIMYYCMMYNEGAFVDWSTGKCNFNSPEFIGLLEFVNRFPEEPDYDNEVSTPSRIQNGEVLLDTAYISNFREIQMYNEIFGGKVTFIGYPTMDGSVGCSLRASDIYAITSKSAAKEGAWAFIESYLSANDIDRWSWGFSSNKKKLEEQVEEAIKVETFTWTDEDGVEHVEQSSGGGSVMYQDGWSYEYHTPTREEADQVLELIRVAKPAAPQNSEIMSIISEEAEAFYKGQKSAAEAADVIQRRIQNYVDENR